MTKEPLPTTHNAERGDRSMCREEPETGPSLGLPSINLTVWGFEQSFGEQTWRKQLGETLWRYMRIGEYLEEY